MSDYDMHLEMLQAETGKVSSSKASRVTPPPERKGNSPAAAPSSIASKSKTKQAGSKSSGAPAAAGTSVLDFFGGGGAATKKGTSPEPQPAAELSNRAKKAAAHKARKEEQQTNKSKAQLQSERDKKANAAKAKLQGSDDKPSRREAAAKPRQQKNAAKETTSRTSTSGRGGGQRESYREDDYSDSYSDEDSRSSSYDDDSRSNTPPPAGGSSRWERDRNGGGSSGPTTVNVVSAPPRSKEEERDILDSTVYLKYLSNNMTRKQLRDTLDECGTVEKVRVCEPKGAESAFMYGFVQFDAPEGAIKLSAGSTPMMRSSNIVCSTSHNLINDKIAGDVVKGGPYKTSAFGVAGRDSKCDATLKQFALDSFNSAAAGAGGPNAASASNSAARFSSSAVAEPADGDSFPSLPGNHAQPLPQAGADSVLNKLKMAGLQVDSSSSAAAGSGGGGLIGRGTQQAASPVQRAPTPPPPTEMEQLILKTTEALELGMNWVDSGMTEKKDYGAACFRLIAAGELIANIVSSAQDSIAAIRVKKKAALNNIAFLKLSSPTGPPEHLEQVTKLMTATEIELTLDVIAVAMHTAAGDMSKREIRTHAQNTLVVVRDRVRQILNYTTDPGLPPKSDEIFGDPLPPAETFSTLKAALTENDGSNPDDAANAPQFLVAQGSPERERFMCHVVNCLITIGMLLEKESSLMASTFYTMALRRIKDELSEPGTGPATCGLPATVTAVKNLKACLESGGSLSYMGMMVNLGEEGASASNGVPMAQYIFGIADLPPPDLVDELPVVAIQMFEMVARPITVG